jgi:cysteine synthase
MQHKNYSLIKSVLLSLLFFGTLLSPKIIFASETVSQAFLDEAFSAKTLLDVNASITHYLVKTPLIPITTLSEDTGKKVFLKDEARQLGSSFKTRGLTYEVFNTFAEIINQKPRSLRRGVQLVTQTDGNHGVALILAITTAIEKFTAENPLRAAYIKKFEPIVFTYANILPLKRAAMDKALARYREVVGDVTKGQIIDTYHDYASARAAREKYIAAENGRAIYMEHGGLKTMQGYGSAAIEILAQLKDQGITDDQKVCVLLPIGAGGPIGVAAAMKALRPNSTGVMVQTPRYGAFVRSYYSGTLEYNDGKLSPYTVTVSDEGVDKEVIYEDGISVDGPESAVALQMALKYIDAAILSEPQRALSEIAPLLLADCDTYYRALDGSQGIVGGTTAIVGDALLANASVEAIADADVIVLFGTEGTIDEAIIKYTRKLLEE